MTDHIMTETEISRLKLVEIELLDELDRVCEILDIKYYMVGGTLLGAVRHKGFIPWDDDIDVVMYRNDLEILENNAYLFNKNYFLQTETTDTYYPLMTSKLRKNDTVFLESCMDENLRSHSGIFIDIFPLDDISDVNSSKIAKKAKLIGILTTVICEKCGYHFDVKKETKLLSNILGVLGVKKLKSIRKKLMTSENGQGLKKCTIYASNYGYKKQCRDKNVYGKGVRLTFENKQYLAPENYTSFLTQLFGQNYMELPPIEKRVTRHPISKLDFRRE